MERKHIPETENRLLILYALRCLGPMTATQLLQLMVELDLMNYFTLQLSLPDLEEQGQLRQRVHPCGTLLELTREGDFTLKSFEARIPSSRRKLLDARAQSYRLRFLQEQLAPAESFTLPEGKVCIRLRLLEKDASMLDLLLCTDQAKAPSCLQQRWHACAQDVYSAVMQALTGGFDRTESFPEVSREALQQISDDEWLLSLADDPEHPSITLMLPLPLEDMARCAAVRWPQVCALLHADILSMLQQAEIKG